MGRPRRALRILPAAGLVISVLLLPPVNVAQSPPTDNGIYVDVKVYDNAALETMLSSALAQLKGTTGFAPASLASALGNPQVETIDQTQTNLQLNSPAKTSSTAPPGQTSAGPSFSAPTAAPSLSASQLLSSQTELTFQIAGLQLLLQGALSDRFVAGTTIGKSQVTMGFPITIHVPPGFQYLESVADVEFSVCLPPGTYDSNIDLTNSMSIVNLIPQENTYNVASIVSSSTSIGGGVVAGVMNGSASLLRGHQTYYMVKDQDTLAIPRPSALPCGAQQVGSKSQATTARALTFAWQFRPVLGEKVVHAGTRQTFAQISLPSTLQAAVACGAHVFVQSSWRRYDPKTGRVGNIIPGSLVPYKEGRYYTFNQPPSFKEAFAEDNGDGNVTVTVTGAFKTGIKVRIGSLLIDSGNSSYSLTDKSLRFTAPGSALALNVAKLLDSTGQETDLMSGVAPTYVCKPEPDLTKLPAPKRKFGKDTAAAQQAASRDAKVSGKKPARGSPKKVPSAAAEAANQSPFPVPVATDEAPPAVVTAPPPAVPAEATPAPPVPAPAPPAPVVPAPATPAPPVPTTTTADTKPSRDVAAAKKAAQDADAAAKKAAGFARTAEGQASAARDALIRVEALEGTVRQEAQDAKDAATGAAGVEDAVLKAERKAEDAAEQAKIAQAATQKAAVDSIAANPPAGYGVVPLNDSTSELTLPLIPPFDANPSQKIPLVVIGNSVFGLRNNPFLEISPDRVKLVVTNDLLRNNRTARFIVLFDVTQSLKPGGGSPRIIPLPLGDQMVLGSPDIVQLGSGLGSPPTTVTVFAITGKNVKNLIIVGPPEILPAAGTTVLRPSGTTETDFAVPDAVAKNLKYIVVQSMVRNVAQEPFVLTIPAASSAGAGNTPTSAKSIDAASPVAPNATTLPLTGTGMTQVAAILYGNTLLSFTASSDTALTVTLRTPQNDALSPPLTAGTPITLQIIYNDKSMREYQVPIQAATTTTK